MGKPKQCCCEPILICSSVIFSLRVGEGTNNVPQIATCLYFTKTCNTATLEWCTFGGVAQEGQTSTTAQNFCIPPEARPSCDQVFTIAGRDNNTGNYKTMNIVIYVDGKVSFLFNLEDTDNLYPIFNGGSVTWITFGCPSVKKLCC